MKYQFTTLLAMAITSIGLASAQCSHNGDAARWVDNNSPAAVVSNLCNSGGGCFKASGQGTMCINGDLSQCPALEQEASNDQSYHGDWFLWSAITCGSLSMTITV